MFLWQDFQAFEGSFVRLRIADLKVRGFRLLFLNASVSPRPLPFQITESRLRFSREFYSFE